MRDKQLDLGQYKLHQLLDIEPVSSVEDVKTLLTPRPHKPTEQQKISDVEPVIQYDRRYLGESEKQGHDQYQQSTLDLGIPIETDQALLDEYRK